MIDFEYNPFLRIVGGQVPLSTKERVKAALDHPDIEEVLLNSEESGVRSRQEFLERMGDLGVKYLLWPDELQEARMRLSYRKELSRGEA